ncbi:MAG: hypothetical protein JJ895_12540 [Balneolaceae bacterium]|nr:hypothetical protein [Balneolaceae bacterium]
MFDTSFKGNIPFIIVFIICLIIIAIGNNSWSIEAQYAFTIFGLIIVGLLILFKYPKILEYKEWLPGALIILGIILLYSVCTAFDDTTRDNSLREYYEEEPYDPGY